MSARSSPGAGGACLRVGPLPSVVVGRKVEAAVVVDIGIQVQGSGGQRHRIVDSNISNEVRCEGNLVTGAAPRMRWNSPLRRHDRTVWERGEVGMIPSESAADAHIVRNGDADITVDAVEACACSVDGRNGTPC